MPPEDSKHLIIAPPGTPLDRIEHFAGRWNPEPSEGEYMPTEPHEGRCRVCGRVAWLSAVEHIPPRGAFNKGRGIVVDPHLVLVSESLDAPEEGTIVQGGIRAYTLCDDCNNPRWAREYSDWAAFGVEILRRQEKLPPEVDQLPGYPCIDRLVIRDVRPGRFIRQVISMFLSISGSHELAERLPDLHELVLGGPPRALPSPLRVYVSLYGDTRARFIGGPTGQFMVEGDVERRLLQLDFLPFGFMLLVDGPPLATPAVDISEMTECDPDETRTIELTDLPVGFGHKLWPTEYRTRGQLLADRIALDDEDAHGEGR